MVVQFCSRDRAHTWFADFTIASFSLILSSSCDATGSAIDEQVLAAYGGDTAGT